jgi:hypothetical protein
MTQAAIGVVPDGSGLSVRTGFNLVDNALKTMQYGAVEPSNTEPGELWFDTGSGCLKKRNSANSAWQILEKTNATVAPTSSNDSTEGYIAGSRWYGQTLAGVYTCVDITGGAGLAVWREIGDVSSGIPSYFVVASAGPMTAGESPYPDGYTTVPVTVQKAGSEVGTRGVVNLIEGSNVTLTVADNAGQNRVDVTVAATSGAVAVEDEGTQILAAASRLNFTGSGVTVTDAGGNEATVAVSGAGATNAFGTIAVSGQSDVVADAAPDTLTLVAGSGILVTTSAATDTITHAVNFAGSGAANTAARSDHTHTQYGGERAFVFSYSGKPGASQSIAYSSLPGRTLRIASGLSSGNDLQIVAEAAATSNTDFVVSYSTDAGANWSVMGTVRISGRTKSIASGFSQSYDILGTYAIRCVAPATPDATLSGVGITLKATVVA